MLVFGCHKLFFMFHDVWIFRKVLEEPGARRPQKISSLQEGSPLGMKKQKRKEEAIAEARST
jgi:hypothetical protein